MPKRPDTDENASVQLRVRFTRTVWDRICGMARYCKENPSQLIRRLLDEKRRALIAAGERPRLKPPEDANWSGLQRAPLASGETERASVARHLYFSQSEKDRAQALAWHLGMRFSELVRTLEAEERQRMYDAGKRPPLRPTRVGNDE